MHKNYFFLNRFVIEANALIKNSSAIDIFSQEKEKLIFELRKSDASYFLEICVNPGFPYIILRDEFYRAKKNSLNIFPALLNERLLRIQIAKFDRIIKLELQNSQIYFAIRGKFTNIVMIKGNQIESFKKYPDEILNNFADEVQNLVFSEEFNIPVIKKAANSEFENEIKKYPVVSKNILKEVKIKIAERSDISKYDELIEILNEIKNEKPAVFINEGLNEIHLAVTTFKSFSFSQKTEFDTLIDALDFYFAKKNYLTEYESKRKLIEKHLDRELKKIVSKLNRLKARIDKGNNEELYKKIANLLLINIKNIKKGMQEITVRDIYTGFEIKVKLNPELSASKNIDYYFDKSYDEKISYEKSQFLYSDLKKLFLHFKDVENKLSGAPNIKELNLIMKELNIRESRKPSDKNVIKPKFKQYIIENKYHVFVGKDSQNNDLLTTKFAKQNDYWFHARGLPGSHLVLRVENVKEPIPKNILKAAASLAAFHSKAKTAGTVPVSFTQKKYVVKKKGMAAGKVALLKENVLLVKPEIPDNCSYIENE